MDTIDIIKNVKDDIEFADQFTVLESKNRSWIISITPV